MVTCGALYPGQGAQYPAMAVDLHNASQAVRDLFTSASDAVGRDLLRLLSESGAEALQRTENTQVAVTLANRAAALRLADLGIAPLLHAGFSLGELSAYAASGVLDDHDLFTIVSERGRLMAEAGESAAGRYGALGMAAVIGLSFERVQELFALWGVEQLYCANDNGPSQVVVSGLAKVLEMVSADLKSAGARRVVPLKVSGPFHTPFMHEASVQFADFLSRFAFADPLSLVYATVTGLPAKTGNEIKALCSSQLESPIRWTTVMRDVSMRLASGTDAGTGAGAALVLEAGPGSVLSGLWKQIDSPIACTGAGTEAALQQLLAKEW